MGIVTADECVDYAIPYRWRTPSEDVCCSKNCTRLPQLSELQNSRLVRLNCTQEWIVIRQLPSSLCKCVNPFSSSFLHDCLIRGWQNYVAYGCQNSVVVVDPQTVQVVQTLTNGTANITKVRTRTRTHTSHTHTRTHTHTHTHVCTLLKVYSAQIAVCQWLTLEMKKNY